MDVPRVQDASHFGAPPVSSVDSLSSRLGERIGRFSGIAYGLATQGFFAVTVWYLFFFLRDGVSSNSGGRLIAESLSIDLLLALQYAVIHSLLLHPRTRKRLSRWISRPFYGSFYCNVTCATLLFAIAYWQPVGGVLYDARSTTAGLAVQACFYGSWAALFYSLHLSGLGYQTGLTPWWYWLRRLPQPKRTFEERGAYRLFRHPIYLSFLGLIWFTPLMTIDHALLTAVWTVYIFLGSHLKDERLAFYLGDSYREYQSRVPGYPLLRRTPLGIRRLPETSATKHDNFAETQPQPSENAA